MSSPTAFFEHAYYIGNFMGGILYGVSLMLYFTAMNKLYKRYKARQSWIFFTWFSTLLVALLTIDIAVNAVWGEMMWINGRDGPAGVPGFIATQSTVWYQALGSASVVAMALVGDALLVYRLFIIWGSNYWVVALPFLTYLAALALGILELYSAFIPGGFFFSGGAVSWGTPYYSIIIGMNVIITSLICARLLLLSRRIRDALTADNAKLYTGVVAILVESATPYTVIGLVFLGLYAKNNNVGVAIGQVWAKLMAISPQMIILRVVSDKAWTKDTANVTGTTLHVRRDYGEASMLQFADSKGISVGDSTVGGSSLAAKKSAGELSSASRSPV
ncbi:hypothetical protein K474DRAFT_1593677 [Panus rudis PR-1116 ss-1]|nr:hypothetical protein K474DRAFT_1593677 [Panus rudis PR-1116 ss-1]